MSNIDSNKVLQRLYKTAERQRATLKETQEQIAELESMLDQLREKAKPGK